MGASQGCPSEGAFARFLAGVGDEGASEQLAKHADGCSSCALLMAIPKGSPPASASGGDLLGGAFRPGEIVADRYRIRGLLGRGGMGEVYEVLDLSLSEHVALKTVRSTISDDPRAVARLKSEVLLARKVTHSNVCRIFDFGVHGAEVSGQAVPFLTMELLRGATLAKHLRSHGPLPLAQIVDVGGQLAAGLAAAHKVGVIHKDLKSENVILTASEGSALRATVTDFGLAATRDLAEVATTPRFSGTPGYVAPERQAGAAATEASDVYALGVVLDEMLTGSLNPTPAMQRNLGAAAAPLVELARRCRSVDPSARPSLAALLKSLQALEPTARSARRRARRWPLGVALVATSMLAALIVGRMIRAPRGSQAVAAAVPVAKTVAPGPLRPPTAPAPVAESTSAPASMPLVRPRVRPRARPSSKPTNDIVLRNADVAASAPEARERDELIRVLKVPSNEVTTKEAKDRLIESLDDAD
jgi:serine/threonine protein kinase